MALSASASACAVEGAGNMRHRSVMGVIEKQAGRIGYAMYNTHERGYERPYSPSYISDVRRARVAKTHPSRTVERCAMVTNGDEMNVSGKAEGCGRDRQSGPREQPNSVRVRNRWAISGGLVAWFSVLPFVAAPLPARVDPHVSSRCSQRHSYPTRDHSSHGAEGALFAVFQCAIEKNKWLARLF